MRGNRTVLPGDAEAQPAGDAAPAQHGVRRESARQTKRIHPRPRADIVNRPRTPSSVSSVAKRRTRRGGRSAHANTRAGGTKRSGKPRQNKHDRGFAQINAPRASALSSRVTGLDQAHQTLFEQRLQERRYVAAQGLRIDIVIFDSASKIRPTRQGAASMVQISVATALKLKYAPARKLRRIAPPSRLAAVGSLS